MLDILFASTLSATVQALVTHGLEGRWGRSADQIGQRLGEQSSSAAQEGLLEDLLTSAERRDVHLGQLVELTRQVGQQARRRGVRRRARPRSFAGGNLLPGPAAQGM